MAPIHKWCNGKFLQICSDKIYILDSLRVNICKQIFIFGWTIPLIIAPFVVIKMLWEEQPQLCNSPWNKLLYNSVHFIKYEFKTKRNLS